MHITGTVDGTQFPYPSVFYPDGQLTVVGGLLELIGTQLPLLKVNPDAHETELAGGRQFPNPSVEKPDGQSEGNGFETTSGTHYELLSLWNPELHPDEGGTTGVEGVYYGVGVELSQQQGHMQQSSSPHSAAALASIPHSTLSFKLINFFNLILLASLTIIFALSVSLAFYFT